MNYIKQNKAAWEEAFDKRSSSWGKDRIRRLKEDPYPYLDEPLLSEIKALNLQDKDVAQFCCNDGRELLSIAKHGVRSAIGFDIAENMIAYAKVTSRESGIDCDFVAVNILEIPETYHNRFDLIVMTIGVLIWFDDLDLFFKKVSDGLKPGGKVIIHELHPFTNMLGVDGEEGFDAEDPKKLMYPYFNDQPRISESGIFYLADQHYDSKVLTDFVHPLEDILNAMSRNHLILLKLKESEEDISELFNGISHSGFPLSILILGQKGSISS